MNPLDILKLISSMQGAKAQEPEPEAEPQGLDLIRIAIQQAEAKRAAQQQEAPAVDDLYAPKKKRDEDDEEYRERE